MGIIPRRFCGDSVVCPFAINMLSLMHAGEACVSVFPAVEEEVSSTINVTVTFRLFDDINLRRTLALYSRNPCNSYGYSPCDLCIHTLQPPFEWMVRGESREEEQETTLGEDLSQMAKKYITGSTDVYCGGGWVASFTMDEVSAKTEEMLL